MIKNLLAFSLALAFCTCAAQPISKTDYTRAVSFLWDNINNKKAFQLSVTPNWFTDSTGFWYVHFVKNEKTFYQVAFKPLKKTVLFDHTKLAEKLSESLKEKIEATALPITGLKYINPGTLEFTAGKKQWEWNTKTSTLKEVSKKTETYNGLESKSPDGKWIVYTENYNLFIRSTQTGVVKQLSTQGKKDYEYGSYYGWSDIIEGENGKRPDRLSVNWSKDSKWIQTSICDLRNARKMYLLDWSVDTLYRAKLLSYYRGSPGDTTVVHLIPTFFNVETGKEFNPGLPRMAHENGYSVDWLQQPGTVLVSYNERGFQKAQLVKIDLNTQSKQALYTESSTTNVDGFGYTLHVKADKLVLTSERSGWKQLYTFDLKTSFLTRITLGDYFINSVTHINEKENTIYFFASGKEVGRNPYQQYLYSVSLDGKNLKLLTPEEGNHEISFSPDNRFMVDNYSTPQQPTVTVLRDVKSGKVLMELSKADVTDLVAMKWSPPQPFTAEGKDGKSTIYGLLWKPTNFDPARQYPIIDHSYTGPHGQIVPRTFSRGISINNQALAELGFIVMMVDGLGTAGRSKEFHNYSYKKMGYNLEDHVRAIQQLSRQHSWIDTTRVGIFGHSAGGYDAGHAMLQYPDFYKVAVASSADHDFRMEKAWWPEMYMGWPVDSTYHQQSNITMASRLKGKLLIVHGGLDENVNPSATFKLAEMLVRADKQFDMLIFPSQRHGYQGPQQQYFTKKRWNYFVEHLLNQKPVWDFEWK
jgi:dipeptidyl aminopeptidase/acylaminoacyl peptidase